MYHGAVETLAQRVTRYIRRHKLLNPGDRVGVAVSSGLDSVALLRLLLELRTELGLVLSVVHFNHKLRGAEADADEQFVAGLASQNKLEFHCERGDVAACAAAKRLSIETAAREMRYEFFRRLLLKGRVNRIATAHTLDDQAETVLLRVVRGAGTRGLAGIYPQLSVSSSQFSVGGQASVVDRQQVCGSIVRPLLGVRRKELEAYLIAEGQSWREDSSNRDLRHARNRVRHGILPRLERNLNPAVRETLAETAEIARAEEEYWSVEVGRILETSAGSRPRDARATVGLESFANLPLALQRRLVRVAAENFGLRLEFRHVEKILDLISNGCPGKAALPDGWMVSIDKAEVKFEPAPQASESIHDYRYLLPVPGKVPVPETGTLFEAVLISAEKGAAGNAEHLLDSGATADELTIRNWRPGDRFWPAHTKGPKKVKELLQEKHVTGEERRLWPVIVSGKEIVWVRGFPTPARLQPRQAVKNVIAIREAPLRTS
jgi:tRNA(Ile)-lysidine synthase